MATKDITDVMVVKAFAEYHKRYKAGTSGNDRIQNVLSASTGENLNVCWRAMERAMRHGFVDFGANLGSGFLTTEGEALLAGASE